MKEDVKFVNLTKHSITVLPQKLVIPTSDTVVSVDMSGDTTEVIQGVPVETCSYKKVFNLPDPQEGVYYIVSAPVGNALRGIRNDILTPGNTTKVGGKVVGCHGLKRWM